MAAKKQYNLENYYVRNKKWFINAIINIPMRIFSPIFREKELWVFGSWLGQRFDDNSRYLFEYINKFHPEIEAVWISKNKSIVEDVSNRGYKSVLAYSKKGKRILKKAGALFCTNGLDDFSEICPVYGATIVRLDHFSGVIKKTGYMINNNRKPLDKKIRGVLRVFKNYLFFWDYFTYYTGSSKTDIKTKMDIYRYYNNKKYVITGAPRNDYLKRNELFKSEISDSLCGSKNILFMPTYRPYKNTITYDLFSKMEKDNELMDLLEKYNYKILFKPHNMDKLSKTYNSNSDRFIILSSDDISSTQDLLLCSDVLVTDYSSCCIDFALKKRPIVFYVPDYIKYDKAQGILDDWMTFYKTEMGITESDCFIRKLKQIIMGNDSCESVIKYINDIYEDESIRNTIYCENIISLIKSKLNINN